MSRRWLAALALGLLGTGSASAGWFGFGDGIGSAMIYGPYTGGHGYSYNVAYGYGFAFSAADTWRSDPLAYPAGVYPYPLGPYPPRRYLFPTTPTCSSCGSAGAVALAPVAMPASLVPVPEALGRPALVRIQVPAEADVWIEGDKTTATGPERIFRSPPLNAGTRFVYTVRAKWKAEGKEIEQVQAVGLQAGQEVKVSFPRVQRP
jgi:uncharacterized protein (TIGR03000 family)